MAVNKKEINKLPKQTRAKGETTIAITRKEWEFLYDTIDQLNDNLFRMEAEIDQDLRENIEISRDLLARCEKTNEKYSICNYS